MKGTLNTHGQKPLEACQGRDRLIATFQRATSRPNIKEKS
jgi:hypothetical protein